MNSSMKVDRPKILTNVYMFLLFGVVIGVVMGSIAISNLSTDFAGVSDNDLSRQSVSESQEVLLCRLQLQQLKESLKAGESNGESLSLKEENEMLKAQVAAYEKQKADGAGSSVEVEQLRARVAALEKDVAEVTQLRADKAELAAQYDKAVTLEKDVTVPSVMSATKRMLDECSPPPKPATQLSPAGNVTVWKGYGCRASESELQRYLNYTPRALCPQDWFFVQRLIFTRDCFSLPRRRCMAVTPARVEEPLPRPASLFNQSALMDSNIRWDLHYCKSFECLNTRTEGDCRNCFNLTLESHRWKVVYRGAPTMDQVIAMKPSGSLRLGLDVGGGTGSFAAHMALHGVTVMTTAFNVETVYNKIAGLPYMEAIALRGLIPLHVPHKSRLPFFDGTLDVIHSVNSIKYIPPLEYEDMIFEWDRVLRVGGLLWFEMFYAPVEEMPLYINLIELLGYKKRYWNITPKTDAGEREGAHVYLNAVMEKPARPGIEVLDGPSEEDKNLMFSR